MSVYLAHLVGLAQGRKLTGESRPALTPRFAGLRRAGLVAQESLVTDNVTQHPAERAALKPLPPGPEPLPHIAVGKPRITMRPESVNPQFDRDQELMSGGRATSAEPRSAPPEAIAVQPRHNSARAVPLTVIQSSRAPIPPIPSQPPTVAPAATPPIRAQLPSVEPASAPPSTRAQPLSEVAVASMRMHRHEAPPIIEVMIDRIDIRAPAPERTAAPAKRKRAEPAVALGDYLRGHRGQS